MQQRSPHVLGIDDGPFRKKQLEPVPIVGVMMEGPSLVEGVAITRFPVDGDGVTVFLATWVRSLRWSDALQAVVLGGVAIAGLAIVDLEALARSLGVPAISVTRKDPSGDDLGRALETAGLGARRAVLARLPEAVRIETNLYARIAGGSRGDLDRILATTRIKSKLPEPLRVAHLVAAATVRGESRGRA